MSETSEILKSVADDPRLLEIGRKAIEDALIEFRDSRLSQPLRSNGCVVREADGKSSDTIRFGPEAALKIGLNAIAAAVGGGGE